MLGLGLEPKGIGTSANSAGFEGRWVRPAAGATKIWTFFTKSYTFVHFYSARNDRIASAVLATAIPSVCPSVRPSVRHTPVLCQNDGT